MAITENQIQLAVEALQKGGVNPVSNGALSNAMNALENVSAFEDLDDDDFVELAESAIERMKSGKRHVEEIKVSTSRRAGGGPSLAERPRLPAGVRPSAPFRFVTLEDHVVRPQVPTDLDMPIKGGVCASIRVEWVAETPLLAGEIAKDGKTVEPVILPGLGKPILPAPTLRGLLRSGLETIAGSRLAFANLHRRYGVRDFEHDYYKNVSPVSRVAEVKAGWLELVPENPGESASFQLIPLEDGWAHIEVDDLIKERWISGVSQRKSWIEKGLEEKYRILGMTQGRSIEFTKTVGVSTSRIDEYQRRVVKPNGPVAATLVVSNKLPGKDGNKHFEYVFYKPGTDPEPILLTRSTWQTFERLHSRLTRNRWEPDGSWAVLKPVILSGGRVPVFYVGDPNVQGSNFALGLTRLFKVPHKRSVEDVLYETQKQHMPRLKKADEAEEYAYECDFVEQLFGYVVEKEDLGLDAATEFGSSHRKGRIAFAPAVLMDGCSYQIDEAVKTIQMAPRPSYGPFYLKSAPAPGQQTSGEKDYSAETTPRLAGRKFYPPRTDGNNRMAAGRQTIRELSQVQIDLARKAGAKSVDVESSLRFLLPKNGSELRFSGGIRMNNVTPEELGAILFVLTHGGAPDKPYRHMLGRAKPFGAGQMRVDKLHLSVEANDDTAAPLLQAPDEDELFDPLSGKGYCIASEDGDCVGMKAFIDRFISFMKAQPGFSAFPAMPSVEEFLGIGDPSLGSLDAKNGTMNYMPLKDFRELQKQTKPRDKSVKAPRILETERDGRYLAAPRRKFWR